MDGETFLSSLGPKDLVLVGDNLWDPDGATWTLGGEQRLFQALAGLAQRIGLQVVGIQPHAEWARWEGEGIRWVGVPPGKRSGWRRWLWNRRLHSHLSPRARVIYSYAELAHPRRVPGAVVWQHGVAWDGRSPERQWPLPPAEHRRPGRLRGHRLCGHQLSERPGHFPAPAGAAA